MSAVLVAQDSAQAAVIDLATREFPAPIADASARFNAAHKLSEQCDAAVLVMRVSVHMLAVVALAVRARHPPVEGERAELHRLLGELARRGHLTEGQWLGVLREALLPFKGDPRAHPMSALVSLLHGSDAKPRRAIDGLLGLRNRLAHEGALTPPWGEAPEDEVSDDVTVPESAEARAKAALAHIVTLLDAQKPLWSAWRVVSPRFDERGGATAEATLMGATPAHAGWRVRPANGLDVEDERPLLRRADGMTVPFGPFAWLGAVRKGSAQALFLPVRRDVDDVVYATPHAGDEHGAPAWAELSAALRLDATGGPAPLPEGVRPFRGLASFEERERELFFGRSTLIDRVRGQVETTPVVVITGLSGSGKSSLLHAGVLPRMRERTVTYRGEARASWRVASLRFFRDPMRSIEEALLTAFSEEDSDAARAALREDLADDGRWRARCDRALEGQRLLVAIDQAEELFTLLGQRPEHDARRREVSVVLARIVRWPGARLLLVCRDDHALAVRNLGALREVARSEDVRDVVEVAVPTPTQLRAILAATARRAALSFEEVDEADRARGLRGLLDRMVDDVQGSSSPLPLVQFTADQLWRESDHGRLTIADYERIGGVEGALGLHAEAVYALQDGSLREDARRSRQALMREYLLLMFTEDGARRPLRRSELPELETEDGAAALRQLEDGRLVIERVQPGAREEALYEPVHESLARQWEALRGWRAEDAEWRAVQRELAREAASWQRAGKEATYLWRGARLVRVQDMLREKRFLTPVQREFVEAGIAAAAAAAAAETEAARRKRRVWSAVGVVALAVAVAFGVRETTLRRRADQERRVALASRARAESLIEFMVFDLRDRLSPIGRLDLMDAVNDRVARYYASVRAAGHTMDLESLRREMVLLINRGDQFLAAGRRAQALAAYREAMTIARRLVATDPRNTEWQRDLSVSHIKIGDVLVAQGDGPGARRAYQQGLAIAERLAQTDPRNTQWQRDLSLSHDSIGNVLVAQGDGPGALRAYQQGLAIAERLAQTDPRNTQWQRDLSVSHERIGDVLVAQGDGPGALRAYQQGLAIAERLAQTDPRNTEWQRDLSVSHERIGDVLVAQGDGPCALRAYQQGLAIAERLAQTDPRNTQWQRDLSVGHERIGGRMREERNLSGALIEFRESATIWERLHRLDPGNADWQAGGAVPLSRIGEILSDQGDAAGARSHFVRARDLLQPLHDAHRLSAEHERLYDTVTALAEDRGSGAVSASGRVVRVLAVVIRAAGLALHEGATCDFRIAVAGAQCQTDVVCGGVHLYGGATSGAFPCTTATAPVVSIAGEDNATNDSDGAFAIDTRARTLSVRDEARTGRPAFTLSARITEVLAGEQTLAPVTAAR